MKHTKGPWKISGGRQIIPPDWTQGHEFIASVARNTSSETESANARLIAAAPELLEALKKLESWRLAAIAGSGIHGGKSECLKDFDEARVAIIKAI